jgi:putative transposase
MLLSYRFRLYPSKTVQARLSEHLELCRWLYNHLLSEVNKAKEEGQMITQRDAQALIVELKKGEKPELSKVYSKVLQMVNHQLWSNIRVLSALKRNGRKVGWLRYKGRGWFKTLNYNQSGFKIEGKKLILSKIGAMPIKLHRPIEGRVKGVIIKRTKSDRWYAIFQVEERPNPLPKTGRAVGIDLGLRHFLTDSEGRQIEDPRFYRRTLEKIKRLQRSLLRKMKGSKNREKARVKLARAYEKLVNQRNDFLHKLSRFYVNNYDVICVEDLRIQNMARNHNLAQSILDASWGKFLRLLCEKAERATRRVVKVNPRSTSEGLCLDDPHRDYISACRILSSGLGQPLGPVERRPLLQITAQAVITGQVFSVKQEAPP